MIINIVDYKDERKQIEIGEINQIDYIHVEVFTGDEIIEVYYKDGTEKEFDSSEFRLTDYFDGEYDVDQKDIEKWSDMDGSSYDRMEKMLESSK